MCRASLWTGFALLALITDASAQTPDRSGWPFPPLNAPADLAADEAILRGAKVATDGPGLIEFFHRRVVKNEADQKQIDDSIQRLGSGRFREREKAMADLIAIGPPAKAALLRMADHPDKEVRRRVAECLAAIEAVTTPEVESAALRVLRDRKPAGSCKALLAYLSTVRDPGVEEDALAALLALAVVDGKVDADVVSGMKDSDAVRRGAAVLILARSGSKEQQDQVRQLLRSDPASLVRLRGAQGLVAAKDRNAVSSLLPLLTDAPFAQAEQARDLLELIAADKAPTSELKDDPAAREKCRDAWETWWDANQAKLDLSKADVDLPWLNSNGQARAAVTLFTKGMETRNADMLKKSMGVPFSLAGFMVIETRQELEQMFISQLAIAPQQAKVEFDPPRFVDTRQYLAKVRNEQLTGFFKRIPVTELRVVALTGKQDGRKESAYLFIRVRAGKAHIVGLGLDEERMLTK